MKQDDELAHELIRDRLDQQIEAVDSFNTRAGLMLATCGVMLAAYAGLLGMHGWVSHCRILLSVLEMAALLVAGYFALSSLVPGGENQPWHYNPDPRKLMDLLKSKHPNFADEVMKSMVDAYDHNREVFKKKFDALANARIALYVSGSIFALHLLIFLLYRHG